MKSTLLIIAVALSALAIDNKCIVYACNGHSNMKYFLSTGGEEKFIDRMTGYYPGYTFKIIDGSHLSCPVADMGRGGVYLDTFKKRVASAADSGIVGGLLMMFGYVDGKDSANAENFLFNTLLFIEEVRLAAKNENLPVFIGRYEKKCNVCGVGVV